jgi:hypothetical protein
MTDTYNRFHKHVSRVTYRPGLSICGRSARCMMEQKPRQLVQQYQHSHLITIEILFMIYLSLVNYPLLSYSAKFTIDATTLSSCALSLTLFSFSHSLLFPLLLNPPVVFTCNLTYKLIFWLWVSLNKLMLSNQRLPHIRNRHTTHCIQVAWHAVFSKYTSLFCFSCKLCQGILKGEV